MGTEQEIDGSATNPCVPASINYVLHTRSLPPLYTCRYFVILISLLLLLFWVSKSKLVTHHKHYLISEGWKLHNFMLDTTWTDWFEQVVFILIKRQSPWFVHATFLPRVNCFFTAQTPHFLISQHHWPKRKYILIAPASPVFSVPNLPLHSMKLVGLKRLFSSGFCQARRWIPKHYIQLRTRNLVFEKSNLHQQCKNSSLPASWES